MCCPLRGYIMLWKLFGATEFAPLLSWKRFLGDSFVCARMRQWYSPMLGVHFPLFGKQLRRQGCWHRQMPISSEISSRPLVRAPETPGGGHGVPCRNKEVRLLCRLLPSWSQKWEPSLGWDGIGVRLNISLSRKASIGFEWEPHQDHAVAQAVRSITREMGPSSAKLDVLWSCAIRSSPLAFLRLTKHSEFLRTTAWTFLPTRAWSHLGFCSAVWKWQQLSVGMSPFRVMGARLPPFALMHLHSQA